MAVKLTEPITGGIVEAYDEEAAARLISRGFKRCEAPKAAKRTTTTRKRTSKKEQ